MTETIPVIATFTPIVIICPINQHTSSAVDGAVRQQYPRLLHLSEVCVSFQYTHVWPLAHTRWRLAKTRPPPSPYPSACHAAMCSSTRRVRVRPSSPSSAPTIRLPPTALGSRSGAFFETCDGDTITVFGSWPVPGGRCV
jgi:hypothetical protein